MAEWPYNTAAWKVTRRKCLVRDKHLCQLSLPNCKVHATEAHHLVPPSEGGDPFDLANVVAVCKSCNIAERNARHAAAWRREQGLEDHDVSGVDEVGTQVSAPW